MPASVQPIVTTFPMLPHAEVNGVPLSSATFPTSKPKGVRKLGDYLYSVNGRKQTLSAGESAVVDAFIAAGGVIVDLQQLANGSDSSNPLKALGKLCRSAKWKRLITRPGRKGSGIPYSLLLDGDGGRALLAAK